MKELPNPMRFKDFRTYLRARLKAEGLSYREFAERHAPAVGLPALGQLLSNKSYRMGNEAFHRLLRSLRLGRQAEAHLLFLKLEDDVRREQDGSRELRRSLDRWRRAAMASEAARGRKALEPDAQAVGEVFEIFPDYLRFRLAEHLLVLLEVFSTRHPRSATLENVREKVDAIRLIAKSRL